MKKMILMMALLLAITAQAQTNNSIRLIRNATLRIQYAGQQILVDPMLGEKGTVMSALNVNANPRVNLVMPVKEVLKGIDFTLLTHTHFDHYDSAAVRSIQKDMRWYVQTEDLQQVKARDGFFRAVGVADSVTHDGITIIRVRGSHGRGEIAKLMGFSSGYVLKAKGQPTIYIMGDCVWDDDTKRAIQTHQPDYIVMNTGGNILIPLSITDGPLTMNEKEALTMISECDANTRFIAVHMDAVDHGQTTRSILRNQAVHDHMDMRRLLIPEDGETIVLKK